MKKLLLVALLTVIGLSITNDVFGGHGYNKWKGYGAARGVNNCPPPPCCEREETITVRVPPQKVCGWVCPDGTDEKPTGESRLVGE